MFLTIDPADCLAGTGGGDMVVGEITATGVGLFVYVFVFSIHSLPTHLCGQMKSPWDRQYCLGVHLWASLPTSLMAVGGS